MKSSPLDFWETALHQELQKISQTISPVCPGTDTIMQEIIKREHQLSLNSTEYKIKKERNTMTHTLLHRKKFLLTALITVLCLTSATCFALSRIDNYIGHSTFKSTQYPTAAEVKDILSAEASLVKTFDNGFTFTYYSTGEISGQDENGTVLDTVNQITCLYQNPQKENVILNISPILQGEANEDYDELIPYNDEISLQFSKDHYKFVPPGYTITPEEQKRIDDGQFYISFGSDTVEEKDISFLCWKMNGLNYNLSSEGTALDQNALIDMAKEIITQK